MKPFPSFGVAVAILVPAVLFFINLGGYDLWPPDEPRFALIAREMMQTGDYLTPRVNGVPYEEKPPLMFWGIALLSWPLGDVNEWTARIPSALAGVTTVVFAYLLAQSMFGARIAFWAALMLTTTFRFWWEARVGQLDMLLTAWLTIACYSLWRWHKERRGVYLVLLYAAMAMGALTKGPPGFIFPALAALAFYWREKRTLKNLRPITGLVLAAVPLAAWLIPARMAASAEHQSAAGQMVAANIFRQTLQRFFVGVTHANPPWYYLEHLPLDLLPWTLFVPWCAVWAWKRRKQSEEVRFLLSWIVPSFVFFCIAIEKRAIYLLPIYPALAVLLSCSMLDWVGSAEVRWQRWMGGLWGAGLSAAGVALLAIPYTHFAEYWTPWFYPVSALAVAGGAAGLVESLSGGSRRLPVSMAVSFCVSALCLACVVLPALNEDKSAGIFCAPLRSMASGGEAYSLFSLRFPREEYAFYAEHRCEPVLAETEELTGGGPIDLREGAQVMKLLGSIDRAVKGVDLPSIEHVSDTQIKTLQTAIETQVANQKLNVDTVQKYEGAVRKVLDSLSRKMESAQPGFIIVQERDWRWVLALYPGASHFPVVRNMEVGGRRILLAANTAGAERVRSLQRNPSNLPR